MKYITLIVAVLQFLNYLVEEGRKRGWIKEGEDRAYARVLAEQLRKSEHGKEVLAEVTKLDAPAVDALLRSLEGPEGTSS